MALLIKICGLSTEASIRCAVEAGADMIGFVFHPKSPRFVTPERAGALAAEARGMSRLVALTVNAGDAEITAIQSALQPDLWQMHGKEPIERLQSVRARTGRPVMKALGWAGGHDDYDAVLHYEHHTDMLLLDAKPPEGAAYPGGHGRPFDWASLAALPPEVKFMLSGGLSPETVGEAIRTVRGMGLSLLGVDVSSGVESAPGVKDLGKIRAFVAAAREAQAE